jgi:hypothetical protein
MRPAGRRRVEELRAIAAHGLEPGEMAPPARPDERLAQPVLGRADGGGDSLEQRAHRPFGGHVEGGQPEHERRRAG